MKEKPTTTSGLRKLPELTKRAATEGCSPHFRIRGSRPFWLPLSAGDPHHEGNHLPIFQGVLDTDPPALGVKEEGALIV